MNNGFSFKEQIHPNKLEIRELSEEEKNDIIFSANEFYAHTYDFVEVAASTKIANPELLESFKLDEKWEQIKKDIADLEGGEDARKYVTYVAHLKIAFPDKYAELTLNEEKLWNAVSDLVKEEKGANWRMSWASSALCMAKTLFPGKYLELDPGTLFDELKDAARANNGENATNYLQILSVAKFLYPNKASDLLGFDENFRQRMTEEINKEKLSSRSKMEVRSQAAIINGSESV